MSDTPARMTAAELARFDRDVKAIRHVPDTHASFYGRTWIDLAAAERVERDAPRVVAYVADREQRVEQLTGKPTRIA